MISLLQTKTAHTAHTVNFASDTRPLSQFFIEYVGGGAGDEAMRNPSMVKLDQSGNSPDD